MPKKGTALMGRIQHALTKETLKSLQGAADSVLTLYGDIRLEPWKELQRLMLQTRRVLDNQLTNGAVIGRCKSCPGHIVDKRLFSKQITEILSSYTPAFQDAVVEELIVSKKKYCCTDCQLEYSRIPRHLTK